MALYLCTLLWDMYALKQLYVWLIHVCSVKIFVCGFELRFVILCKVHLCLSRRPKDLGRYPGTRSYRMRSGGATFGFEASLAQLPSSPPLDFALYEPLPRGLQVWLSAVSDMRTQGSFGCSEGAVKWDEVGR